MEAIVTGEGVNISLDKVVQEANGLKRILWGEAMRKIAISKNDEIEVYNFLTKQGVLTNHPKSGSVLVLDEDFDFALKKGYFFASDFYATQFSNDIYGNKKIYKTFFSE